jgi:hypothetical protein
MVPILVPTTFPVFTIKMPGFSVFWIAFHDLHKPSTHIVEVHSTTRNKRNIRNC